MKAGLTPFECAARTVVSVTPPTLRDAPKKRDISRSVMSLEPLALVTSTELVLAAATTGT
jgi:hypothetical protein